MHERSTVIQPALLAPVLAGLVATACTARPVPSNDSPATKATSSPVRTQAGHPTVWAINVAAPDTLYLIATDPLGGAPLGVDAAWIARTLAPFGVRSERRVAVELDNGEQMVLQRSLPAGDWRVYRLVTAEADSGLAETGGEPEDDRR